jgi:aspartyl/glutamyl-tRNA(Asn/Gln) amidotransferase C subunit
MPQSLITKDEILKILKLSRLSKNPSLDLVSAYQSDLETILEYVNQLKTVDTSSVASTDVFRKIKVDQLADDQPYSNQAQYQQTRTNIINLFPAKRGDLLLLPIQVVE